MKKNFIPKLLLSVLPFTMVSVPNMNFYQANSSEVLMCEAVASFEVNPEPTIFPVAEIQIKPSITPTATPKVAPVAVTPPVTPSDLDAFFDTYANQYGISSTTLKVIANCESRFNPAALSKSGTYGGLFQYSASTWASTRRAMGLDENPELRFNAEEAIKTTAFKIANGGIGAWPHCGKKVSLKVGE